MNNLVSLITGALLGAAIIAALHASGRIALKPTTVNSAMHQRTNTHLCAALNPVEMHSTAQDVTQAPRDFTQVLASVLTDEQRRRLSHHEHVAINASLKNDSQWLNALLDEIISLENNARRRHLILALKQVERTSLLESVYQLVDSRRAIDQESAIDIAIELHRFTEHHQLIVDLFDVELAPSAQLHFIFAFSERNNQLNPLDFYAQLHSLYQASDDHKIKEAIIHALSFSKEIRDVLFAEILSLMQNDVKQTEIQRLRSIQHWIENYAIGFNPQQKMQIKQYSESLYFLSDRYELKKIAIEIGGAV